MSKFFLFLFMPLFLGASDPKENITIKQKKEEIINRELDKILSKDAPKSNYTSFPVSNGIIKISDRYIEMPKTITFDNAGKIVDKISFYNRKNGYPIFLVIDICYGGSVIGGEKIIRAIETSKAKVYIVVKSFAASMAAIIVSTFQEYSYVMKNAVIFHHEISSMFSGNVTQQKDKFHQLNYWQEVLFHPLAKRKGITVNAFIESLYRLKTDGQAGLFATEALKEKWIMNIIEGIEDESFSRLEDKNPPQKEEEDTSDKNQIPFDFYHIYKN